MLHLHPACKKRRVPPREKVGGGGGSPDHISHPRPQGDHTGPATSVPAGKGTLGDVGALLRSHGAGRAARSTTGHPVPGRAGDGGPRGSGSRHIRPPCHPPSPGVQGGVPTVCLGVPGDAGPCLGSRLAAPRQPRRKGHGTGGGNSGTRGII